MNIYETSGTVEEHGQVNVAAVPFAPGTEVEITIRQKASAHAKSGTGNLDESPIKDLFARVRARNTEPIGPLRGEELYDRKVLR